MPLTKLITGHHISRMTQKLTHPKNNGGRKGGKLKGKTITSYLSLSLLTNLIYLGNCLTFLITLQSAERHKYKKRMGGR